MKKIPYLLILLILLVSCDNTKQETSIKNVKNNIENSVIQINDSNKNEFDNQDKNQITNNSELVKISKQSPYKELSQFKNWTLRTLPEESSWNFLGENGEEINIVYKSNPYLGGKSSFKFNDIELIDLTDCKEWKEKEGDFEEDVPMFVKADCIKYFNGFSFNGKVVEVDLQNSFERVYISKNTPEILIYGGKLVINYIDKTYKINDENFDFDKNLYILLTKGY